MVQKLHDTHPSTARHLFGPVKRDSAELASNSKVMDDRKSDFDAAPCFHANYAITASRFMMSSNSIVSSMSMTVSSPTWEWLLMPAQRCVNLRRSVELAFVHLCFASAEPQVNRALLEVCTNEDGRPGKRWNCDSSSRSFRVQQELEGLRWLSCFVLPYD